MIKALSQIRREAISPTLPPSICASLLQWHRSAQTITGTKWNGNLFFKVDTHEK